MIIGSRFLIDANKSVGTAPFSYEISSTGKGTSEFNETQSQFGNFRSKLSHSVVDTNFNEGEDTERTFLEEQYQFNGTGTFNINDTKHSMKFYPSVSKRIKA